MILTKPKNQQTQKRVLKFHDEISFIQIVLEIRSFHPTKKYVMGIDPGSVNLGIARVHDHGDYYVANLYEIHLTRNLDYQKRLENYIGLFSDFQKPNPQLLVIEGAGYSASPYRQVELETVRTVAAMISVSNGVPVIVPQPNEIRKAVFGNGKSTADVEWKDLELPKNAGAALSCALFGMAKQE